MKYKRECSFCGKTYKTDNVVAYLCPDCKKKAESLPENDESNLKLLSDCEDLGIIAIDAD